MKFIDAVNQECKKKINKLMGEENITVIIILQKKIKTQNIYEKNITNYVMLCYWRHIFPEQSSLGSSRLFLQ